MSDTAEFLVIGGGIAGVSVASALAAHGRTIVLEMEERPAFHSTGRSAAFYAAGYGNEAIRTLTTAGEAFFYAPPDGFTDTPLIRRRDWIFVAREDQLPALADLQQSLGDGVARITGQAVESRLPILRLGYVAAALIDRRGGDLDVDALLQGYVRLLRKRDAMLVCNARVTALAHERGQWCAMTTAGEFRATVVVNAAGAWADDVAALAGLLPIGIEPKRRTAILIDIPGHKMIADWPLIMDVDEEFYFKPDGGRILVSPADETPSEPCDPQPDDIDVAYAVDKFERATTVEVRRVGHKWAGLRVFAPDRSPVAGFDPRAQGFFWLAGQGGYGVQTAPGLSQFAMSMLTSASPAAGFESVTNLRSALSPARFLTA
jgi:D-arginine dehydrogenase